MSIDCNTTKEWKNIPEYEGYYQASNHGEIRSIDRIVLRKGRRGNQTCYMTHIKESATRYGYRTVCISKFGLQQTVGVHRLVLMAFAGLPPTPKHECNHINGVKDDNNIENLEWVTRSENLKHAYNNLDRYRNTGELNGRSKLTEGDVLEIRQLYATGNYTQIALGKLYRITNATIHNIVKHNTWKHVA